MESYGVRSPEGVSVSIDPPLRADVLLLKINEMHAGTLLAYYLFRPVRKWSQSYGTTVGL